MVSANARVFLIAVFLTAVSHAQTSALHQQILQTYSFQPHMLTPEGMTRKSGELDQFWAKAKSDPTVYASGLRQELADLHNPPFFLFDGSMLLLSLSDTPADRKVALAAIAHSDLRDVQPQGYFFQVHRMATLGEDATTAAFHILEDPDFKVFVPEHVLTLGQNYCLVYMLLPTRQDYWLQAAIDRLQKERDENAQKSLILLLWYSQTDAAEKAITSFAGDTSKPAGACGLAKQTLEGKQEIGAMERAESLTYTETSLREKRRERMKAVSDEALIDLDKYTMMLAAKRK